MLNLTFSRGEKAEEENKNSDTDYLEKLYVGVRFVHNTVFQLSKILCFFFLCQRNLRSFYIWATGSMGLPKCYVLHLKGEKCCHWRSQKLSQEQLRRGKKEYDYLAYLLSRQVSFRENDLRNLKAGGFINIFYPLVVVVEGNGGDMSV